MIEFELSDDEGEEEGLPFAAHSGSADPAFQHVTQVDFGIDHLRTAESNGQSQAELAVVRTGGEGKASAATDGPGPAEAVAAQEAGHPPVRSKSVLATTTDIAIPRKEGEEPSQDPRAEERPVVPDLSHYATAMEKQAHQLVLRVDSMIQQLRNEQTEAPDLNRQVLFDITLSLFDQLVLLLGSKTIENCHVINQVVKLVPHIEEELRKRKLFRDATQKMKDVLLIVDEKLVRGDLTMLQDQINLNIWVARSYMRRLQEAPDDFELSRRIIYYYSCAHFSAAKYSEFAAIDTSEIALGIDYTEAHFLSRAVPPYLITQRFAFAETRPGTDAPKIAETFAMVEKLAQYMLNYYNCEYASRLFNAATMQTILGLQKKFPTLTILDRAMQLLPTLGEAALTNTQVPAFVALKPPAKLIGHWRAFREVLVEMRRLASFQSTFDALKDATQIPYCKIATQPTQLQHIVETRALVNKMLIKLLADIATYCVELLGSPPVHFAVIAMGSLGRGDAGPYSDVEYALVVAEEKKLKDRYFTVFRELFEFTIDCIGERFGTHIDEQGTPKNPSFLGTAATLIAQLTTSDVGNIGVMNSLLRPRLILAVAPSNTPHIRYSTFLTSPRTPPIKPSVAGAGLNIEPEDLFFQYRAMLDSHLSKAAPPPSSESGEDDSADLEKEKRSSVDSAHHLKSSAKKCEELGQFFLSDHQSFASMPSSTTYIKSANAVAYTDSPKPTAADELDLQNPSLRNDEPISLKKSYLQPLIYILTDIALYNNVKFWLEQEATVDIIASMLHQEGIFSAEFTEQIKSSALFLWGLKCAAQLYYKEQVEDDTVYFHPSCSETAPYPHPKHPSAFCAKNYRLYLTLGQRHELNMIEWAVLRPLFRLVTQMVSRPAAFFRAMKTGSVKVWHPGGQPTSLSATSGLDPAVDMIAKTQSPGELNELLLQAQSDAGINNYIRALVYTLIWRQSTPRIHRVFFRAVIAAAPDTSAHKSEYRDCLATELLHYYPSHAKLILVMCDAFPDAEGSRHLFRAEKAQWEKSLRKLLKPQQERQLQADSKDKILQVFVSADKIYVPSEPNDTTVVKTNSTAGGVKAYQLYNNYLFAMRELFFRLIGFGMPRMALLAMKKRRGGQNGLAQSSAQLTNVRSAIWNRMESTLIQPASPPQQSTPLGYLLVVEDCASKPTLSDAIKAVVKTQKQKGGNDADKSKKHARFKSLARQGVAAKSKHTLPPLSSSPPAHQLPVTKSGSSGKSGKTTLAQFARAESKKLDLSETGGPSSGAVGSGLVNSSSQPSLKESRHKPIQMSEKMQADDTIQLSRSVPQLLTTNDSGVIVPPLEQVTIFNKCYSCRTFTDILLASVIVGMSANATDLVIEEYQDPISECLRCKYRVAAGNVDAVRFLRGTLDPVVFQPNGDYINIQLRNILFCFDAMTLPLNRTAAKELCSLSSVRLIHRWLKDLSEQNSKIVKNNQNATPPTTPREKAEELKRAGSVDFSKNSILIPQGLVEKVETRFRAVVEFLKKYDFEATGLDLLKLLYPLAGRFYRSLLARNDLTPIERFALLEKNDTFPVKSVFTWCTYASVDLCQELLRLEGLDTRSLPADVTKATEYKVNWASPATSMLKAIEDTRKVVFSARKQILDEAAFILAAQGFPSSFPRESSAIYSRLPYHISLTGAFRTHVAGWPNFGAGISPEVKEAALASITDYSVFLHIRHRVSALNLYLSRPLEVFSPNLVIHNYKSLAPSSVDALMPLASPLLEFHAKLVSILEQRGKFLTLIDLRGSTMTTNGMIYYISDLCPKLRFLDVSKTSIQAIYKPSKPAGPNNYSGLNRTPLKFPSLEWIRGTDNEALVSVIFNAPKLKHGSFARCPQLKEVEIHGLEAPANTFLNIEDTAIPDPYRTAVTMVPALCSCLFRLEFEPELKAKIRDMLEALFLQSATALRIVPVRLEPKAAGLSKFTFSAEIIWNDKVYCSTVNPYFHFIFPRFNSDSLMEMVTAAIREAPKLEKVAMVACDLSSTQSELITAAAIQSKTVTYVDLSSNSNGSGTNKKLLADVERLKPKMVLKLEKDKD